jgi:hypothetical protein
MWVNAELLLFGLWPSSGFFMPGYSWPKANLWIVWLKSKDFGWPANGVRSWMCAPLVE